MGRRWRVAVVGMVVCSGLLAPDVVRARSARRQGRESTSAGVPALAPSALRSFDEAAGIQCFDRRVQDWLRRVPKSCGRPVAVLDADGTLWRGDLGTGFCRWLLRKGHMPEANRPEFVRSWRQWKRGKMGDIEMFKQMVTCMKGMKETKVRRLADTYFRRALEPQVYRPMKALIQSLKDSGVDVHVVSGTNGVVLGPALKKLGIPRDHIMGMDVAIEHGRLTDRFTRVTWQQGKVQAIDQALGGRPVVAAAGDSYGDLAMIGKVGPGGLRMLINPAPEVEQAGRAQGWIVQRLDAPASTTPPPR